MRSEDDQLLIVSTTERDVLHELLAEKRRTAEYWERRYNSCRYSLITIAVTFGLFVVGFIAV